jgi:hypothetical protein
VGKVLSRSKAINSRKGRPAWAAFSIRSLHPPPARTAKRSDRSIPVIPPTNSAIDGDRDRGTTMTPPQNHAPRRRALDLVPRTRA